MKNVVDAYNAEIKKVRAVFESVPWENPKVYAEFLAQTFFYATHTTRILALAGIRQPLENHDLHLRFLSHAGEERGHDKMLINDLKRLGRTLSEFKCAPATAALFQSQYYWIEHVNPNALFGYILLLEGLSLECGPHLYERTVNSHKGSTTYLKVHIEEDEGHVELNFKNIEKMSAKDLEWIEENLRQTSEFYCGLLRVAACAASKSRSSAAA